MSKLKLMTIVGTRPEIIKMSAIIKKADKYFDQILVHTGQNYDYTLNEVFFKDLDGSTRVSENTAVHQCPSVRRDQALQCNADTQHAFRGQVQRIDKGNDMAADLPVIGIIIMVGNARGNDSHLLSVQIDGNDVDFRPEDFQTNGDTVPAVDRIQDRTAPDLHTFLQADAPDQALILQCGKIGSYRRPA